MGEMIRVFDVYDNSFCSLVNRWSY